MNAKVNCWEAKKCGREPGGENVAQLGVCPAATDESVDGANDGLYGGRLCWAIAGTFCGGEVQGSGAVKQITCLHCDFFEQVMREEGRSLSTPIEVSDAQARRLMITALVVATCMALYVVLYRVLWPQFVDVRGEVVIGAAIIASLGVAYSMRFSRASDEKTRLIGFGYEAFLAFALSFSELVALDPHTVTSQVSWVCVLIMFFPLLVRSSPRAMVLGSLLAASMSPLAYLVVGMLGAPRVDDGAILAARFIPQYMCALITFVPATVMNRLVTDVKRARRLGSYELVELLGAGGMGEVWRARHRMLVRPAAVKLIRGRAENVERMRGRFEREAQTTAALESPHTVQLYDFGVSDEGAFYYVMELLRGIDLEHLVLRFGPQPPERVVYLMKQVCDSLAEAHQMLLIHRDIKPSNIFASVKGRHFDFVKVLDFGLVKLEDHSTANTAATLEGAIVGTPAYLAPEFATGQGTIDGRADVYALGCVAYWLLTGEQVFEADTALKMAVCHVTLEPTPPSERIRSELPESLERIVMACLAKSPEDRPTAIELEKMLDACELESPWDEQRAESWWRTYLPQVVGGDLVRLKTVPSPPPKQPRAQPGDKHGATVA